MRVLLLAIAGACGAALLAFVTQWLLLHGAGVDPLGLDPASLVLEVMELHRHALLGAVVGSLLGPFPARPDRRFAAVTGWLVAGAVVVLAWPLAILLIHGAGLPTVAELAAGYRFQPGLIPAGLGAAASCALLDLLLSWQQSRQHLAAYRRHEMGGDNRVDETLKEFWQHRAERYLAEKGRQSRPGGPP